jgi:hypothetical protein
VGTDSLLCEAEIVFLFMMTGLNTLNFTEQYHQPEPPPVLGAFYQAPWRGNRGGLIHGHRQARQNTARGVEKELAERGFSAEAIESRSTCWVWPV